MPNETAIRWPTTESLLSRLEVSTKHAPGLEPGAHVKPPRAERSQKPQNFSSGKPRRNKADQNARAGTSGWQIMIHQVACARRGKLQPEPKLQQARRRPEIP